MRWSFLGVFFLVLFKEVQSGYLIEVRVFFSFYFGLFSLILCFRSTHTELRSSLFNHLHRKGGGGGVRNVEEGRNVEEKRKKELQKKTVKHL